MPEIPRCLYGIAYRMAYAFIIIIGIAFSLGRERRSEEGSYLRLIDFCITQL